MIFSCSTNDDSIYGWLDAVRFAFKTRRIGIVRGLKVYIGCKDKIGKEVYGEMNELKEREI